jgi:hypothetical protein
VDMSLELYGGDEGPDCRFIVPNNHTVQVLRGEADPIEISRFFYRSPPVIRFADGAYLEGNEYVALRNDARPYDASKIETWDWTGTDLRRESQGPERDAATIQARVIRELSTGIYDVIVDDDASGEVADVVAIRMTNDGGKQGVQVDLFHCKFSGEATPGARVGDLYELCGQAQKCISWMSGPERQTDIFTHLLRRDANRRDGGGPSRIELGTPEVLQTVREVSRTHPVSFRVFIVQPGLSKGGASRNQLELLSVTENHLMETYQIPFHVIASP